jgi:DNA-binding XRE family transcriptional regulator
MPLLDGGRSSVSIVCPIWKMENCAEEPKTLGEHLRKRRMDLGLRQSDVAAWIGVGTQTVNYWENNRFMPEVLPCIPREQFPWPAEIGYPSS